jgi:hypothetical protein
MKDEQWPEKEEPPERTDFVFIFKSSVFIFRSSRPGK